jgi:hypothetical protein
VSVDIVLEVYFQLLYCPLEGDKSTQLRKYVACPFSVLFAVDYENEKKKIPVCNITLDCYLVYI